MHFMFPLSFSGICHYTRIAQTFKYYRCARRQNFVILHHLNTERSIRISGRIFHLCN